MANSALIDDLLKQFAENPRRVFARLANEYRKRGELDSAIEICRSHVPLQPGYISGHIVLGQALYDRGSLDEARTSFETALTLDPENLIALRHMGDIAHSNGDADGAREWYRQLLEIDPQNEEVSEQLASLGSSVGTGEAAASSERDELAGWGEVTLEPIDLGVDDTNEVADLAPIDAVAAADVADEEFVPDVVTAEVDRNLAAAGAMDAALDAPGLQDASLEVDGIFDDAVAAEASVQGVYGSIEEVPAVFAMEGLEVTSFGVDEGQVEAAAVEAVADEPGDAIPDGQVEGDDTFATETMAELYLQQGYPDRALDIYRDLAARNPEDDSLSERIAELTATEAPVVEAATAAPVRTAREFFGALAYRRAPHGAQAEPTEAPEPERESEPDAVAEQTSQLAEPVNEPEYFESEQAEAYVVSDAGAPAEQEQAERTLEFDPEEPFVEESAEVEREASNGRPGREADSALSLDNVFRDAPGMEESASRNGLSFDEFFARRTNGDTSHSSDDALDSSSDEGASGEGDAEADEPHDLELFHAWLDGLKG